MKNLTDKQQILSQFEAARAAKDWDKAQRIINRARERFPADSKIEEVSQDFAKQRSCYDTAYMAT